MLGLKQIATGSVVGLTFGFALNRGLMDDPDVIRKQFTFDSWLMMRMFLTANLVSTAVVLGLHVFNIRARQTTSLKNAKELQQNLLGGALLGSGMVLTGSCPGTVWAQMGSQISLNTLGTFLGGIAGSGLFAYALDKGSKLIPLECKIKPDVMTHAKVSYFLTAAYMVAVIGAIYALNQVFPWQEQADKFLEYQTEEAKSSYFRSWDPVIAGAMIGVLQIPTYTILGCGLGSSSGWMYITNLIRTVTPFASKTMSTFAANEIAQLQAIQAIFMAFGAFISQALVPDDIQRKSMKYREEGIETFFRNFFGGICLLVGARIAGGCTSGHGLTGMANLNPKSFITVASMFSAGSVISLLLPQKTG